MGLHRNIKYCFILTLHLQIYGFLSAAHNIKSMDISCIAKATEVSKAFTRINVPINISMNIMGSYSAQRTYALTGWCRCGQTLIALGVAITWQLRRSRAD